MSATEHEPALGFDLDGARRAILRYQPSSNWVSASRDPTPRMTVGLGFDVAGHGPGHLDGVVLGFGRERDDEVEGPVFQLLEGFGAVL